MPNTPEPPRRLPCSAGRILEETRLFANADDALCECSDRHCATRAVLRRWTSAQCSDDGNPSGSAECRRCVLPFIRRSLRTYRAKGSRAGMLSERRDEPTIQRSSCVRAAEWIVQEVSPPSRLRRFGETAFAWRSARRKEGPARRAGLAEARAQRERRLAGCVGRVSQLDHPGGLRPFALLRPIVAPLDSN